MNISHVLSSSSNSLPLSAASATGTLASCEINGGVFLLRTKATSLLSLQGARHWEMPPNTKSLCWAVWC